MKINTFICLILLLSNVVLAQNPGDLKTDFGTDGIYSLTLADTAFGPYDITVLSDESILISGCLRYIHTFEPQSIVYKLDQFGNQSSFGNSKYGFEFNSVDWDRVNSLSILSDGKMLLAGAYLGEEFPYPYLTRIYPDGKTDSTFGENGAFTNSSVPMDVFGMKLYQHEGDTSILILGYNEDTTKIMMLNYEGELISTFGTEGIIEITGINLFFADIEIDSINNKLYICGIYESNYSAILKYNLPDGSVDSDFGIDGKLTFTTAVNSISTIIYNYETNKLIAFGQYIHTAGDIDIFAYSMNETDGSPDLTFGVSGWSTLRSPDSDENINDAIMQSDGKYYFAGNSYVSGGDAYIFAGRLNPNGYGDNTFGVNALALTNIGDFNGVAAIALSPENDILYVAGFVQDAYETIYRNLRVIAYYTGYSTETPIVYSEITNDLKLEIFPNPATEIITINSNTFGTHCLKLYNSTGQQVINKNYIGDSITLNIEELPKGVYILKLILPDNIVISSKIAKE